MWLCSEFREEEHLFWLIRGKLCDCFSRQQESNENLNYFNISGETLFHSYTTTAVTCCLFTEVISLHKSEIVTVSQSRRCAVFQPNGFLVNVPA